jgi:prepilin-type N-terminal cleavage/methylation domain-containing protein
MKRLRTRHDDGFTLVESLVVIVVMGVVGAIFTSTVVNALRVEDTTRDRADAQHALTLAVARMTEELRVAAPLQSISPTAVVLDVYPNQPSGGSMRERHTYAVASGALTHRIQVFSPATATVPSSDSIRTIANGLSSAVTPFVGRDRQGGVTTLPSKVASVEVSLRLPTGSAKPFDAVTSVFLRNYQG